MRRTVLPGTDITVSRLALGTGSLHRLARSANRQRVLAAAADLGISHFDTSPYYGYGLAEWELGAFAQGQRRAITIATKCGLYPFGPVIRSTSAMWLRKIGGKVWPALSLPQIDWSVTRAEQSLTDSLKRLRTDYVDFLFLHEPDYRQLHADELQRWLDAERARGRVRHTGLAGLADVLHTWPQLHPLAGVIQTRDSLDGREADFVTRQGGKLQFTYGYLSSNARRAAPLPARSVMQAAAERNAEGAIVMSTIRPDRLAELTEVFA